MTAAKFSTFLLLLSMAVLMAMAAPRKRKLDCEQLFRRSDGCFNDLVMTSLPSVPRTVQEVDDHFCSIIKSRVACFSAVGRPCMSGLSRTVLGLAMRSARTYLGAYCKNDASKMKLIRELSCVSRDVMDTDIPLVLDRIRVGIEFANNRSDTDDFIPTICCVVHTANYLVSKQIDVVADKCTVQTSQKRPKFYEDILTAVLSDATDLLCGTKYDSVASCERNHPDGQPEIMAAMASDNRPQADYYIGYAVLKTILKIDSQT